MAWLKAPSGLITPHFSWQGEAACKHCGKIPSRAAVKETAEWLETIREELGGNPMHITSWCRCAVHNENVGGATNSYHIKGMAVDFVVRNLSLKETQRRCRKLWTEKKIGGLGVYISWTHIDRGPHRKWTGP